MSRRKDSIDRDALREKLIAVAEALVLRHGPEALTARALATHIGYFVGHVYNLVEDLDDLVLILNGRTLDRLHEALEDAVEGKKGINRLLALAQTYLSFTSNNPRLWGLVLGHRLPDNKSLPEDYARRIAALPALVGAELKSLFPKRPEEQIKRDVATLWAALHGLGSLDNTGRLKLISAPPASILAKQLIETWLAGAKE